MVTMVAASLTGATVAGIRPARRWTASMTRSVPCPSASGANQRTRRLAARNPGGSSHGAAGAARRTARSSSQRNEAVEQPTSAPTPLASTVHLTRLPKRVPSSRSRRPARRRGAPSLQCAAGRAARVAAAAQTEAPRASATRPDSGWGRPTGEVRDPRGRWCLGSPQASHPRMEPGARDLGGHHLTNHRGCTHGWTTSFLGARTTRAQDPATADRPPTAGPRLDPSRPAPVPGSVRPGVVWPRSICPNPTTARAALSNVFRPRRARRSRRARSSRVARGTRPTPPAGGTAWRRCTPCRPAPGCRG